MSKKVLYVGGGNRLCDEKLSIILLVFMCWVLYLILIRSNVVWIGCEDNDENSGRSDLGSQSNAIRLQRAKSAHNAFPMQCCNGARLVFEAQITHESKQVRTYTSILTYA